MRTLLNHYGDEASVQIPNELFLILVDGIKNKGEKSNVQQVAFGYSYTALISILYKYPFFLDVENGCYIQNGDIKEFLGYSRTTKTINRIIKRNGLLDEIGVTTTTKDYPLFFTSSPDETINDIPIKDYYGFADLSDEGEIERLGGLAKGIIQNRNYEVKKPNFLLEPFGEREYGSLYDYSNTHTITVKEILYFFTHEYLNVIDFMIYAYLKSKCKGMPQNKKKIPLRRIIAEVGTDEKTLYVYFKRLKDVGVVRVDHRGWKALEGDSEANTYHWKGISHAREALTH